MAPVILNTEQTLTDTTYRLPVSEYIFRRIESFDIHNIFGVPGDYNLSMLEHLYSVPNLNWVGCCNELNSSYAADGYARTVGAGKFGVLLTTQGVGEMSAINGVSGSFAEHVPILHIVGTTPTIAKEKGAHYHHMINGVSTRDSTDHFAYEDIATKVSCKVVSLTKDLSDAATQIDELIKTILITKKPGYLYVPCDIVDNVIDGSNLVNVTAEMLRERSSSASQVVIDEISESIVEKLLSAKNPVVLCDVLTDRYGLTSTTQDLVDILQVPSCNSHMGKTLLNESNPWYIGDFNGEESNKMVQNYVHNTDFFLHTGDYFNEINSGHWTLYNKINEDAIIKLNPEYITIGSKVYDNVSFQDILPVILQKVKEHAQGKTLPKFEIPHIISQIEQIPSNTPISQTRMLETFQTFFKPNDVIVTETCSLMFGLPDVKMPANSKVIGQHYYLSIGMALPCSFGVSVALAEIGRSDARLILIQGDGAAQMTVQELSNYNRDNVVKPLVILLNTTVIPLRESLRVLKEITMISDQIGNGLNSSKLLVSKMRRQLRSTPQKNSMQHLKISVLIYQLQECLKSLSISLTFLGDSTRWLVTEGLHRMYHAL